MTRTELFHRIKAKQSFLCVGLDVDPAKMPAHLNGDVLAFNKAIIDATRDLCVAYKPNTAFYEALGLDGMRILKDTLDYIGDDHFTIADAKRGDIGNTSRYYANFAFHTLGADSITVAPYMGEDSVRPFLEYEGKWAIVLALTSNQGSQDFQHASQDGGEPLYKKVMQRTAAWGNLDQLMFVCGATQAEKFAELRAVTPDHFYLVPGIGAQGGDLAGVCKYGMNDHCGLLVNSSRGILYASPGEDFAEAARASAQRLQTQMAAALKKYLPTKA
ncbi:orotidine-5'-phosphate decarboxylase [Neolewinella antarctica]|uniref:Orotidine-5'-phosphate decarboxylase n=1 Tax=Neolewinella antarctica TaxID=442734 RepID=A0ABX0X7T1_9BACT|nr:orotidine-5'-phosphate decarboxylase [Neolewinella antarctica]NJC25222.1 orotidine-5'-phosphate decarboxylase [Neolewinella antarctica]